METVKTEYSVSEFKGKIISDLVFKTSDGIILMCSIVIASIGLNMNSAPVIIGAMLISPLMTPIIGLGYGLSVLNFQVVKKAVKLLLLEVSVSVVVATIYFTLSPVSYASSEIIVRTSPTIWDVIIAFFGGVVGIIGARKKTSNNIVPRVAIATFLGIRFMRFPVENKINDRSVRKINTWMLVIAVLIVFPSIVSATSLGKESIRKTAINQLINQEFADYIVLNQTYDTTKKKLTLTISGDFLSAEKIKTIQADLPDFGLKDVELSIDQVPNLSDLNGSELTKYLDQYFQNRLKQETNKEPEKNKYEETFSTE